MNGFAPALPLDKTGLKVRHWKPARRVIRGIAGSSWSVRSWTGDSESELASVTKAAASVASTAQIATVLSESGKDMVDSAGTTPTPTPTYSGRGRPRKPKVPKSSVTSTAASSRSASLVPDAHTPHQASKLRHLVAESHGDSSGVEVVDTLT